jgi:hypothetical protein
MALSIRQDTIDHGYQTDPSISHHWGEYSPYFSIPSEISDETPDHCTITFAQILSRHGARSPTASKNTTYAKLIASLQSKVENPTGDFSFLSDYKYDLGSNVLTPFGQQEMFNSGVKFFERYEALARHSVPFFRTTSEGYVVTSADNFTQGFHKARSVVVADPTFPYFIVTISEDDGSNNTLNHGLCNNFENNLPWDGIGAAADAEYLAIFAPNITARLILELPGASLTNTDTESLMDLCPFNTVATSAGTISPFCKAFTVEEWAQYDYFQSLGKYYGYGNGNPLGPTNGVGFTNELIARLTSTPVHDETSTNHTLDSNPMTFPLNRALYADFSHDNDLTGIFSAMGFYNGTPSLSNTSLETTTQTKGYSAAWTVPFSARAYFEKLSCAGEQEELVRVIINDRVLPLNNFDADSLGMVPLSKFVKKLSFARDGGNWAECFAPLPTSTSSSASFTASTTTSTTKLSTTSSSTTATTTAVIAPNCNHDNCLRAAIRNSASFSTFCPTYTAVAAATNTIPSYLANCDESASRVSSACACVSFCSTFAALQTKDEKKTDFLVIACHSSINLLHICLLLNDLLTTIYGLPICCNSLPRNSRTCM